jgi:DNA sulfur modification protein DndC
MRNQVSLFEGVRTSLADSVAASLDSLRAYGDRYRHWAIAYSGGKDSSALATFVTWAIQTGQIPAPASLTILYADTRMELPPLQQSAVRLMSHFHRSGFQAQIVLPEMEDRFFVYMLGLGVPPPTNRFRWCTPKLKIEPMHRALTGLRQAAGEKLLMLTGVRMGESAARDARIAVSCSKDSGECGQGWMQVQTPEALADTLAPLLHWRLCHVYDWLYFDEYGHGCDAAGVAAVYGEDDVRTGCVGCNLASQDTALIRLVRQSQWSHLAPLFELKPLYAELKQAKWRKRKLEAERRADGQYNKNIQRMGPITMEGRAYGLERVLDIQRRAGVDLINAEEEVYIRRMWAEDRWPRKWSAEDAAAAMPIDAIINVGGELVSQPLLVR